ncbi:FecR family protein [Chitinophaga cymbidii]|uniref:Iron dicitrate transporter FecR n=1 Tax=Chitinophaga cymbidii TaxID=1096750 RepID=A0A512RG87_9BACT|nr:FecR domain-containing protein [Chitinophaga cymbidii]GEP94710.1 iron dicitrate transporter FecR [Chitinophaga cymbidii]
MDQQEIISLLNRAATGSITDAEQRVLADGLRDADEPSFRSLTEQYEGIVLQHGVPGEPDALLYERIRDRIAVIEEDVRPVRIPWRSYAAAAAILLLMFAGGAYWYFKQQATTLIADSPYEMNVAPGGDKAVLTLADGTQITLDSARTGALAQQSGIHVMKLDSGQLAYQGISAQGSVLQYNTLTIPRGGQFQLTLPDGTKVWLNSVSSLRYPVAFSGKERVVELQGQAYFEIAQHPGQPFRVKVGDMEALVLGTHFDIMAYDDEHTINTTLVEGALQVKQGQATQLLRPGQQAVRDNATGKLSVRKADIEKATAWKSGFFEFDDAGLPAIVRQLSRWYDVEIVDETNGKTGLFWGRISKNLPLSSVLKLLASNGVQFRIEGRKVTLFQGEK